MEEKTNEEVSCEFPLSAARSHLHVIVTALASFPCLHPASCLLFAVCLTGTWIEGRLWMRLLLLGVQISEPCLVPVADSSDEEEIDMLQSCSENEEEIDMVQSCSENEDKSEWDGHRDHDFVMDGSDVSREQEATSCPMNGQGTDDECEKVTVLSITFIWCVCGYPLQRLTHLAIICCGMLSVAQLILTKAPNRATIFGIKLTKN